MLSAPSEANFTDTDPWRVMRVMSEFVQGFDALADLGPAITIFGSARTTASGIGGPLIALANTNRRDCFGRVKSLVKSTMTSMVGKWLGLTAFGSVASGAAKDSILAPDART